MHVCFPFSTCFHSLQRKGLDQPSPSLCLRRFPLLLDHQLLAKDTQPHHLLPCPLCIVHRVPSLLRTRSVLLFSCMHEMNLVIAECVVCTNSTSPWSVSVCQCLSACLRVQCVCVCRSPLLPALFSSLFLFSGHDIMHNKPFDCLLAPLQNQQLNNVAFFGFGGIFFFVCNDSFCALCFTTLVHSGFFFCSFPPSALFWRKHHPTQSTSSNLPVSQPKHLLCEVGRCLCDLPSTPC